MVNFVSVTLLFFVFISIAHSQNCYSPCSTDSQCSASSCIYCNNGTCDYCKAGDATCQMRSSLFTCYNPKTQICCPNSFSHGSGAICPINNTCCPAFSISCCNDPATHFCCPYSVYAQSCPIGNICCGQNYPVCVDPKTQQCCCGSFSCSLGDTCDCTNSKCVSNLQ
eukprot:TRINITY_DN3933_c0_g1_i1.p1 TRINITY_DN3933_c0_g1~~TRINITY_DN3933_c0_g1_i1.p1  ORF type:complete len:167 (-),score=3.55 TRINITY_DN3933_c0_g1_i1:26-526(-)